MMMVAMFAPLLYAVEQYVSELLSRGGEAQALASLAHFVDCVLAGGAADCGRAKIA
jgi:hypothetical protein